MSPNCMIELKNVTKQYWRGSNQPFTALREVNLQIYAGELVGVLGKSGSGKSTLLNLITGLDRPTSGSVEVAGTMLQGKTEDALARWRGRNIGVVFQFFQLLPTLTVIENVMLAMDFRGVIPVQKRRDRAHYLLEQVGIAEQADKLPSSLSGGEQQRAAIARAMANDPPILVADEPTGNLDSYTSEAIFTLFTDLVKRGATLLMVTHDEDLSDRANRVVRLADGCVVADSRDPAAGHGSTSESYGLTTGGDR